MVIPHMSAALARVTGMWGAIAAIHSARLRCVCSGGVYFGVMPHARLVADLMRAASCSGVSLGLMAFGGGFGPMARGVWTVM
jgi:hypothetical protein